MINKIINCVKTLTKIYLYKKYINYHKAEYYLILFNLFKEPPDNLTFFNSILFSSYISNSRIGLNQSHFNTNQKFIQNFCLLLSKYCSLFKIKINFQASN